MRFVLWMSLFSVFGTCTKKGDAEDLEQVKNTKTPIPAHVTPDTAIFAGGCFWCMEGPFEKSEGVWEAISGYTGGHVAEPTYNEVGRGHTGHREAVLVLFDSSKIRYEQLVEIFWRQIDPTDEDGQFADRGFQYTTAIFYRSESQRQSAELSKQNLTRSGTFSKPIVTPLVPASPFYPAEEHHQDFYLTNSAHYLAYRRGSGRASFLEAVWGNH